MRHLTLVLLMAFSLSAFSQSTDQDSRLQERFSESQINEMTPDRVAYWTYYLDNSYTIMDIAEEKSVYLNELEEVDIELTNFHGLTMNLDSYHQQGAYLKIKGQPKMLVVKPMSQIIEEFNQYYQSVK